MKVSRDSKSFESVVCDASYKKGKKIHVAFYEPDVNHSVIIIKLANCKQLNNRNRQRDKQEIKQE